MRCLVLPFPRRHSLGLIPAKSRPLNTPPPTRTKCRLTTFLGSPPVRGLPPPPRPTFAILYPSGNPLLLFADMSCRSRLATLNEKLTTLERRVEYIEARVSCTFGSDLKKSIFQGTQSGSLAGQVSVPSILKIEFYPILVFSEGKITILLMLGLAR